MNSILRATLLMTLLVCCNGYAIYQLKIPNGGKVPNPCKEGELWAGVGHISPGGADARTKFGTQFHDDFDELWGPDLCNEDADGDGRTNGQELGDPECKWTKADAAPNATDLSHPGICEPTDSKLCSEMNKGILLEGCAVYTPPTKPADDHDHSHGSDESHSSEEDEKKNGSAVSKAPQLVVMASVLTYLALNLF